VDGVNENVKSFDLLGTSGRRKVRETGNPGSLTNGS